MTKNNRKLDTNTRREHGEEVFHEMRTARSSKRQYESSALKPQQKNVAFDNDVDDYQPTFDTSKSNWKELLRTKCIASVKSEKNTGEKVEEDGEVEGVKVPTTPKERKFILRF